ncbi:hypothetical protein J7U46_22950 [Pelomonas sp. V22]|uniref:hypothetical protein n=1 Tax=Pelomonas sp. V22 TaxID=2822139 RepID=UPI0024A7AF30|nr:hypothetical protein [Pelomonas sp. V22]MDI4635930.1 hypothetical protein [Pelomonas sp. V22]
MHAPRTASSCTFSAESWRELVAQWLAAGVQAKAIHAALCRQHGYAGSYSSVYRLIVSVRGEQPVDTTVRLHFEARHCRPGQHRTEGIEAHSVV